MPPTHLIAIARLCAAMVAFIQEMEWKRITIIWQPFESFADYNFRERESKGAGES